MKSLQLVLLSIFLILNVESRVPFLTLEDLLADPPLVIEDYDDSENSDRIALRAENVTNLSGVENEIPQGRVYYSGSQLWKAVIDSKAKIKVLVKLRDEKDISMWGGNSTAIDILVKEKSLEKVRKALEDNEIKFEVIIQDLQKAIDEENPPVIELDDRRAKRLPFQYLTAWRGLSSLGNKLEVWPSANWGHRLTWQAYHRVADINGYLDYLAQTYPDLCTVQTIGNSIQGRPIKLLKISNGQPGNKAVWIDGGIHAREWISPATVTYIINHIVSNYDSEPDYMKNMDFYITPVLNPDGYEYSHTVDRLWRKNRRTGGLCSGIDLNRNFGYKWGGQGSSKNPCTETFGGSGPFSEPETAAVKRFISSNSGNWKAYISFHSYGQYILYPWGYDRVVTPDYQDLENVARQAATAIRNNGGPQYTIGPAGSTLYPASGGSDDWAKGSMRMKYAYTIELRDSGRYGFVLPAAYIQPTAKEALAALRVIAEAAYRA